MKCSQINITLLPKTKVKVWHYGHSHENPHWQGGKHYTQQ
jgi:hypothetical protein